MSDLVQPIKEGKVQETAASTNSKKTESSGNTLGKDAFLQLLVTQMKYQDPLNPSSNTEYVAQLATYSQLEELQNLSAATANSQAFSLVGKNVIIKTVNSVGNPTYIEGRADFVNMSGGKSMLSVNGSLYSIDLLDSVIDDTYHLEQGLPKVNQKTELKYDANNPKNQSIEISLGTGKTVANNVAVAINEKVLDSKLVNVKDNKVIIDKAAFAGLKNGSYKMTLAFNDALYTTVEDMVTLQIQNSKVTDLDNTNTVVSTETGSDPVTQA